MLFLSIILIILLKQSTSTFSSPISESASTISSESSVTSREDGINSSKSETITSDIIETFDNVETDEYPFTFLPDCNYIGDNEQENLLYQSLYNYDFIMEGIGHDESAFLVIYADIVDVYEEENKMTVFGVFYTSAYTLQNNVVRSVSGGSAPVAVTYLKNSDGSYTEESIEQPAHGLMHTENFSSFFTMPVSGRLIDGMAEKTMAIFQDENSEAMHKQLLEQHLIDNGHEITIYSNDQFTTIPDYEYTGENLAQRLLYQSLYSDDSIKQELNYSEDDFLIIATNIVSSYVEDSSLKIFAVYDASSYNLQGNAINSNNTGSVVIAITYEKNGDGTYTETKIERPRKGNIPAKDYEDVCVMPVSGDEIEGLPVKLAEAYEQSNYIANVHKHLLSQHLYDNHYRGIIFIEQQLSHG